MRRRRSILLTAGLLGLVIAGLIIAVALRHQRQRESARAAREAEIQQSQRAEARQLADRHLAKADAAVEQSLSQVRKRIEGFFAKAKQGAPGFAADAMSFGSKMRLAADYVPFTRHDRHATYLRDRFAAHLFSSDDLKIAVELAVREHFQNISSAENRMLVDLRADLADLPGLGLPHLAVATEWEQAYRDAAEAVRGKVLLDSGGDVATLATAVLLTDYAAEVALVVLRQVAARLGVSAGILAVGGESSWATFGIGLVAAVIVDYILGKIWDWTVDPRGRLVESLQGELDRLCEAILTGDGKSGLEPTLRQINRQRTALRTAAVAELLGPAPASGASGGIP